MHTGVLSRFPSADVLNTCHLTPFQFVTVLLFIHTCTYMCASLSFHLSHLHSGDPQIVVTAPSYVIEGNTLTVNCSMMSFPQSIVSLSLGDTPIASVAESYDNVTGLFTYVTTYSTTAMYPSDEGNYTCSATITHGQPAVTEVYSETVFVPVYGESCSHVH